MSSGNNVNNSSSSSAPATPAKPSDKQMNLLAVIMQNVQGKPDINWANVVTQSGLKNERTAKEMYRQITKKFGWGSTVDGSPSGSAGSGAATATPTKVRKRTGKVGTKSAKKGGGKKAQEDEDENGDESDYI